MSSSWPTEIWDPRNPLADDAGMAPYTPPADPNWLVGKNSGLPDDWQDYNMKTNVWDALENPLYKVAAQAKGIDWDDFKSRVNTQIGPEDEYEYIPADMVTVPAVGKSGRQGGHSGYTYNKSAYDFAMKEWEKSGKWGEVDGLLSILPPKPENFTDDTPVTNMFGFSGYTGSIYEDMETMYGWLGEIDSKGKGSYETIAKGPQGTDYGIVGDIWEHYGLDKAPEGPTTLDDSYFSYQENFATAVPSSPKDEWINAAIALGNNPDVELEVTTNQGGTKA